MALSIKLVHVLNYRHKNGVSSATLLCQRTKNQGCILWDWRLRSLPIGDGLLFNAKYLGKLPLRHVLLFPQELERLCV